MRALLEYLLYFIFSYRGTRTTYIISENFNCLAIAVLEVQYSLTTNRRTDRLRSLNNKITFLPFRYGTLKTLSCNNKLLFSDAPMHRIGERCFKKVFYYALLLFMVVTQSIAREFTLRQG